MRKVNLNYWQVYYMDNDRQKRVIRRRLLYHEAVKLCQKQYTAGLSCDYEAEV